VKKLRKKWTLSALRFATKTKAASDINARKFAALSKRVVLTLVELICALLNVIRLCHVEYINATIFAILACVNHAVFTQENLSIAHAVLQR
jgi:hypothetical protein